MTTGSLGIIVTPNHTKTQPTGHASLTPVQPASATLTPLPGKAPSTGPAALYSCFQGSVYKIDLKSKAHKGMKLVAKVQRIWKQAKEVIATRAPYATDIEYTALPNPNAPEKDIIRLSYRDMAGNLQHITDIPPELTARIEKLRNLLRPNRDIQAPEPLKISVPGILPKSCAEFLRTQFKDLEDGLTGSAKTNALRNVVATEAMIQGFSMHLKALVDHKREELNTIPLLPHPVRKKNEEELEKLKKLQEELDSIDRNAVFRAVATWNNSNTGTMDKEKRTRIHNTADKVTLDTRRDLIKAARQNQDEHWIKDKIGMYKPLPTTEAHAYALDAGNLLIAEEWDAQLRREETDRSNTKCCVEHLVVQMMINLESPVAAAHPVLEGFDEETRDEIVQGVIEPQLPGAGEAPQWYPKAYARAVYDNMPDLGNSTDLEMRVGRLKQNRDSRLRLDKLVS